MYQSLKSWKPCLQDLWCPQLQTVVPGVFRLLVFMEELSKASLSYLFFTGGASLQGLRAKQWEIRGAGILVSSTIKQLEASGPKAALPDQITLMAAGGGQRQDTGPGVSSILLISGLFPISTGLLQLSGWCPDGHFLLFPAPRVHILLPI